MHSIRDHLPVSIIIANYNYARFLSRAIDSALDQDHAQVEVIVVDDASTDGSAEVIASSGGRIKACLREENGGHAAAFNTGFAASRGAIVLFLDADDYLLPGRFDAARPATQRAYALREKVNPDAGKPLSDGERKHLFGQR